MLSLFPRLLLRSVTALTGALLLNACSQASPNPFADTATFTPAPRTVCTQADSLNGMQGHTFGEPLDNFSGLNPQAEENEPEVYWMSKQESGWFGQHNKDVVTYYQFQDEKFAMFRAAALGIGANRTALRELAQRLFGPGRERNDLQGGLDWEGERVRVLYYEKGNSPVLCYLEVSRKPLLTVQQAKLRATAGGQSTEQALAGKSSASQDFPIISYWPAFLTSSSLRHLPFSPFCLGPNARQGGLQDKAHT